MTLVKDIVTSECKETCLMIINIVVAYWIGLFGIYNAKGSNHSLLSSTN